MGVIWKINKVSPLVKKIIYMANLKGFYVMDMLLHLALQLKWRLAPRTYAFIYFVVVGTRGKKIYLKEETHNTGEETHSTMK